jgi:excinuclease ABC subunit C
MIDLAHVPTNPGCYLFKDASGSIIYIGKAKNLSKRVKSYFQNKDHGLKTAALVSHIASVETMVTTSEYEALVLENNLIKKHKPKYNIDLRDSRRYAYLVLTDEEYPRLLLARTREQSGEYFGPFVSGVNRDYILESLQKTFKIRTCTVLPKKACIRYALNLCDAPCIGNISHQEYLANVDLVRMVLKGKTQYLVKILDTRMRQLSADRNYEGALKVRNQILAVKALGERQHVERDKQYNEDILHYLVHEGQVYLMLFNTRAGILENKQDFEFPYTEDFLEEFLMQYYGEHDLPKELIVPEKVSPQLLEYFQKQQGKKLVLTIPRKGEKKQLLDLVKKNIEISLFGDVKKLEELQQKLELGELPVVIECFDISHLSGTSTVASMVQFRNGKPDKNNYRKFKIRTVEGIDDYRAMKEVVSRRYSRLKQENLPLPNLVIIDGGKGQLSAVLDMMKAMFLEIPVISLAKREEEIFIPGKEEPLRLSKKSDALKLLQSIRDEAHRFAITYNRLLRSKKMIGEIL